MTTDAANPVKRSSRDPDVLRGRLEHWLATVVDATRPPTVGALSGTDANGMSSDTVLFDASWIDRDGTSYSNEALVARIAPDLDDVPVFPWYDMPGQFNSIRLVHELTDVPVPAPRWCETDVAAIGAPFFVMNRVDGLVPPDVLPYPFGGNWLYDADPHDQKRLQDSTVEAIAALHAIDDAPARFPWLERAEAGDSRLRRHVAHTRAWYDVVAREGARSPLVERAFAWLDKHWPHHESEPVLCWGDARIGNVIYADFTPAALLDWEMAGLGPRELDVTWLVGGHLVFQDLAVALGLPGMPDFLRAEDVAAHYATLTGYEIRDLDFYLAYAATQWAIVFLRTGQRQAHFGERELPADVEELIYSRDLLDRMLHH
jgi:aminoglycoside phosphotransferase (APT) family kinase protein